MKHDPRPTILIVDDVALNIDILREDLRSEYRILAAKNGEQAIHVATLERPDLILLDVVMPGMNGFETCKKLKSDSFTKSIPVIFVTSKNEPVDEEFGFKTGGVDYIHKPTSPHVVKARVKNHLMLNDQRRSLEAMVDERTREIKQIQREVVTRLSIAAEFRDNETGTHIIRIGRYVEILTRSMGYTEPELSYYRDAASLHDLGKIGIPDSILLKPGPLTPKEWEIMKTHTRIGARIIGNHPHSLFRISSDAALSHHEKWDGTGYPNGLTGASIPLIGRIISVCDVFDALISDRPYKKAWSLDKALDHIKNQAGSHFEPAIGERFFANIDEVVKVAGFR